jgi:hypothetical protein
VVIDLLALLDRLIGQFGCSRDNVDVNDLT